MRALVEEAHHFGHKNAVVMVDRMISTGILRQYKKSVWSKSADCPRLAASPSNSAPTNKHDNMVHTSISSLVIYRRQYKNSVMPPLKSYGARQLWIALYSWHHLNEIQVKNAQTYWNVQLGTLKQTAIHTLIIVLF